MEVIPALLTRRSSRPNRSTRALQESFAIRCTADIGLDHQGFNGMTRLLRHLLALLGGLQDGLFVACVVDHQVVANACQ